MSDFCAAAHVQGSNISEVINVRRELANSFNATFASRSVYSFTATDENFPGPLGISSNPTRPDMYLGSFRFGRLPDTLAFACEPPTPSWRRGT